MRLHPIQSHHYLVLAGVLFLGAGLFWFGQQENNRQSVPADLGASGASVLSAESETNANAKTELPADADQAENINADAVQSEPESEPEPVVPAPVEEEKPNYITSARLAEFLDGQAGPSASSFNKDSRLLLVLDTAVSAGQKVESKITVEKAGGGRIGRELTFELYDGEIVIANPGQTGSYAVIIKVGDSETRRIEFSLK